MYAVNSSDLEIVKERYDEAYGALGAAEEIGWPLAVVTAYVAHERWHSLIATIAVFFAVYYFATYRYRRIEKRAQDDYHRLVGLGKYASTR